jgi:hypothetical protein
VKARLVALVVAGVALSGGWWLSSRPSVVEVGPEESVGVVIRTVPDGTVVRLLPGVHAAFQVTRPVSVEGMPGSVVQGPVTVLADGVRLRDLVVTGGERGILIWQADHVAVERVLVRGARLHGIEVAPGSATISQCTIEGLVSPYAQGLEVRNSSGRPRTIVEGCSVSSGQEGLVSHVSRVEFRGNHVSDTSLRAIVITEMSEGIAEGNDVSGVAGVGLYCGDESHCEFRGNSVRRVAAAPSAGRSHGGYGAVARYHATMRLDGNTFEDLSSAEPVGLFLHSRLTNRFPLSIWPPGWRGAVPGLNVTLLSLIGLLAVGVAVRPAVVRRRRAGKPFPPVSPMALAVLGTGFAIQSFHMLEHGVQVYQTYVIEAEQRKGLLGAIVDTEWVHFGFNIAVLLFMAWAAALLWRSLTPGAASLLVAAAVIQGYHFAEHVAKIVQHLSTGVDPAPGLLGDNVGLVWFHYGINLAVYAGFAVALTAYWVGRTVSSAPSVGREAVATT